MVAIAVAVAYFVGPAATAFFQGSAAAGSAAAVAGAVAGGAATGAAASIVSQGFGVATGIQDKFS